MSLPTLEEFQKLEVLPYTKPFDPLPCTVNEIESLFLFSQRREIVWQGFLSWKDRVLRLFGSVRFWLNGSFVTIKENPHDIDVVILVNRDSYTKVRKLELSNYYSIVTHRDSFGNRIQPNSGLVDSFVALDGDRNRLAYWDQLWSSVNPDKPYLSDGITKKCFLEVTFE